MKRKRTRYKNGRERNLLIFLTDDKEKLENGAVDVDIELRETVILLDMDCRYIDSASFHRLDSKTHKTLFFDKKIEQNVNIFKFQPVNFRFLPARLIF
jgi:hypothetical protein